MLRKLFARKQKRAAHLLGDHRDAVRLRGRANRRNSHWRLTVEHLEDRRLLAGLVGIDFGPSGANTPSGWTPLGTLSTPFTQANVADENGNATPFDLTIIEAGPATSSCAANQVCSANATPIASTIPTHSQSLSGLDGQIFSDAHPVTLTWSDLTAGDSYEVYVFGLEGYYSSIQQTVQISGTGSPGTFVQNLNQNQLFVNGEMGSSGRPLSSYAKIATADGAGRIMIQVSPAAFSLDVSLGGVALRELSPAGLTVTIAADSISEAAGPGATTATVNRSTDTANPLTVTLASSDTSEATVPATVTIAAGQTISAPFHIDAVNDNINDGTQTVTVTAEATGHAAGSDTLSVTDDEAATLTVSILAGAISEGDGAAATTAVVSRNTVTTNALAVNLASSDLTEATVATTITIPAGRTSSAPFDINAVDDALDDGTQTVSITASAVGHGDGSESVDVVDDDVDAGLSLIVAADSVSEGAGPQATTATVSRRTGLLVNRVDRGSVATDGVFGTQLNTNQIDGSFAANFRVENPDNSAHIHQVSHESSLDALGLDGEGFANIRDEAGFFQGIGDTSFFDVYFDLPTAHTFSLTGRVAADSNNAAASSTIAFSGPRTLFNFLQFAGLGNAGGATEINQSGNLGPGTYHFLANAAAAAPGPGAFADATYVFDLQLQPATLVVNLASSDTTEATVPATVTMAAGQSASPAFDISAVDDPLVDGTQTVAITGSAAGHADGSDTLDVTDNESRVFSFTITETDGYSLVFEDGSSDTFNVVLNAQPASDVVLKLVSADPGEATVSPASLTFTSSNWGSPQTATITGVNDPIVDGDQITAVTISVDDDASDDQFDPIADQFVQVTTRDVDGSIRGTVWDDLDGNQVQNNEPGLAGVIVYLDLNRNGQHDTSEPTQVSATDGRYAFENVAAGEYVVSQIIPTGLIQTFPQQAFPATTFAQLVNNQATLPVFATPAPRDASRLFIVEKGGVIRILDLVTGQLNPTPFLTVPDTDASSSESGLLGLAFHPDYANNGKFYVNVTVDNSAAPGPFATHIREYRVSSNPDIADPASKREILSFAQPFGNHNGGWIGFSPHDSNLYIASGDGGGGGDPLNSGQSLNTLLGKMLRIDVNGDAFPNDSNANYGIPPTNPFVNRTDARAEIWAYGLRNPWRDSFDRNTGDLWMGDVGQAAREEIDFQAAASTGGENYAWNRREGFSPYQGGQLLAGDVQPVYDYAHGNSPLQGNSVIGGYVYRGPIDTWVGRYFFADSLSDNIWSFDPTDPINTVRRMNDLLVPDGGTIGGGPLPNDIVSFAEDSSGNVYLVEIDGELHKMSKRLPGTHTVIVVAGNVVDDVNFGNQDPKGSSIGDFVWHDLDRDGIQDSGEPGVDGVRVNLLDASTLRPIADTSTAGGGKYGFDGLAAGEYIVEFIASDAFRFSPQDQGDDDSLDSDASRATGRTAVIALPPSTHINTVDAGLLQFEAPAFLRIEGLETNATLEHKAQPGETVVVHGKFNGGPANERLSVEFRWGDGTRTFGRIDPVAGRFAGEHAYRTGGIFEVSVILTSENRGTARASIETVVSGVRLTDNGTLQIIGTRGRDTIRVSQLRSRIQVQTKFANERWRTAQFPAARVHSILVVTCEGNDRVQIHRRIRQPATILGGGGNDIIRSGRGNDVIDGGPGHDFIMSGNGSDRITDRQGNNRIFSAGGDDIVTTGAGRDRIVTGDGNDVVRSGAGDDWIDTGKGHDIIFAGEGHDAANGGGGDDEVSGGPGNDIIHGGAGNGSDVLGGDDGHDRIYGGGNGRNTLIGGRGNDRIWGGERSRSD